MKKIILLSILGLLVLRAQDDMPCSSPAVGPVIVPPGIMLLFDNSGSMADPAYVSWGRNYIYESDSSQYKDTYGYFLESKNYRYAGNRFIESPSGPFPGWLLNKITMSRIDVIRKVMTGGKNTAGNRLNSEGRYYWRVYYRRTASDYTYFYVYHSARQTYVNVSYRGDAPVKQSLSRAKVIVDVPPDSIKGVIHEIADPDGDGQWNDDAPYMGVWTFNYSRAGHLDLYLQHPTFVTFISQLNNIDPATWTPHAESYFEFLHYIAQVRPHYQNSNFNPSPGNLPDPYYDKDYKGLLPCRKIFALLLTDGESTQDLEIPNSDVGHLPNANNLQDYDNDGNDPGWYPSNGSDYLDDLALYAHTNDLRPDLDGSQDIALYAVFSFSTSNYGRNLLKNAAKNGAFMDKNGNNIPDLQEEWDENGDGIPDAYFEAQNGRDIKRAILKAIRSILARAASGSQVAVTLAGGQRAGSATWAIYYPERQKGNDRVRWIGNVFSFWIDPMGYLREETPLIDKTLHMKNDYVIQVYFNEVTGQSYIKRFRDTQGWGNDTDFVLVDSLPLENMNPLWVGGDSLHLRPWDDRMIWTYVDSDNDGIPETKIPFNTINRPQIEPHLGVLSSASADTVIEYTRGKDFPGSGLRKRELDGNVWKLGDIINSSPIVVPYPLERYDKLYNDATYFDFFNRYKKRRAIVYTGANDGMLHAFNAGRFDTLEYNPIKGKYTAGKANPLGIPLGEEMWAYVPYNLLPHLRWLKHPDYCHVYYVDLMTYPTDVKIFTPSAKHPNGWGTVLFTGMRLGGYPETLNAGTYSSAFFALDVTEQDTQSTSTVPEPDVLWEWKDNYLGYTTSYPTIVKVQDSWFLLIGSGVQNELGESFQTGRIFVLNPKNANVLGTFVVQEPSSSIGDLIGTDIDKDYSVDRVYFGTSYGSAGNWRGRVYRLKTNNSTNPVNWDLELFVDGIGPVVDAPSVARDEEGRVWVYFGAGKLFSAEDYRDLSYYSFYGVKDQDTLIDLTKLFPAHEVQVFGDTAVKWQGSNYLFEQVEEMVKTSYDGWRYEFQEPGERAVHHPVVVSKATIFTSFTPTANPCELGGAGKVYALYYTTGTAHKSAILGQWLTGEFATNIETGAGVPAQVTVILDSEGRPVVYIPTGTAGVVRLPLEERVPWGRIILWKGG